ncbi:hypothetical protein IGI04_023552 [Brassica rapa subsp. trilocularis]|uniref:Transposase-associated domain-containing protein n=1 Tax=Brassica rapa subsp. trilocularis TaxID=1813537 RepID=A0ABQ7M475_BRACM|nr:hypothetical protein IGI04_023552 [Brassica rapa subsp. trilocularis]
MSSSNYFRSWIDRPHLDPNTRLLTEEYQRGITEFMRLVHRQPEAKTHVWTHLYLSGFTRSYKIWYHHGKTDYEHGSTSEPQPAVRLEEPNRTDAEENEGEPVDDLALMKRAYTNKKTGQIDDGLVRDVVSLVQTQVYDEVSQLQTDDDDSTLVPKKKGRLVGLSRRSRSAAPSSAPPPYVDLEVLTAQLKDKDDRISALETQMAAQQAGFETQKKLNEEMMEMMKRMYPNEVFPNIQDP